LVVAGWHTDHNPSSQPYRIPIVTIQQQQTNCRLLCKYNFLRSFLPLIVCGLGHGSSALSAHWLSPWTTDDSRGIKFWGKWGGGGWRPGECLGSGQDGRLWTQLLLINCGGSWGWFCVAESWVLLSGIGDYFFQLFWIIHQLAEDMMYVRYLTCTWGFFFGGVFDSAAPPEARNRAFTTTLWFWRHLLVGPVFTPFVVVR
jgi:hypothetical protein